MNKLADATGEPGVVRYDVAILGTGIGGTILGAILARQGWRVLLIESGTHPRFAVGESVVPETAAMFRVLAASYDVPEIQHFSTAFEVRRYITSNCGVKRAFSYVYQREGERQRPDEVTQFPTLVPPFGPDSHFFRQDTDAYMLAVAARYGAVIRQKVSIQNLQRAPWGYLLEGAKGERFEARFVVDASGYASPLAKMYGLRDNPDRLKTNSRSIFTHMVAVRPYDQLCAPRRVHRMPVPFYQGTLHHIFDGGWLWVIAFDNQRNSTNPLCSVGLVLDRRKSPESGVPPEQEFREFIARYPDIAPQFENARAVREWTSTGRLQYSSRRLTGDRFCLLGHAGGFIDPLFSSGMAMTLSSVNVIADALLKALEDDDFSVERFERVETWGQRNLEHFDRLVACAFDSFCDFRLWNAWFRVWTLGNFLGALGPIFRHLKYLETGDRSHLLALERPPLRGAGACDLDEFEELFDAAASEVEAVREQRQSPEEASKRIFALLRQTRLGPTQLRLADPDVRSTTIWTLFPLLRFYCWSKYKAPRRLREVHYDNTLWSTFSLAGRAFFQEVMYSLAPAWGMWRDMLFSWNYEWRQRPARADAESPRREAARAPAGLAEPEVSAVAQKTS